MIRLAVTRIALLAWAFFPATALGLLAAILTRLTGGCWAKADGTLEVHGGFAAALLRRGIPLLGPAEALTLGHVILARDRSQMDACRAHERAHVRQCERWGPLFLPAYIAGSLWAHLRGGDYYRDNPFEVGARAEEHRPEVTPP